MSLHISSVVCHGLYGDHRACVIITKCYDQAVSVYVSCENGCLLKRCLLF